MVYPFTSERFDFTGHDGSRLAARLERPIADPQGFALFAHCFSCSKDVLAASRIARALAERGIAVLRFDFTGLGNSQGDFGNTSFSSNIADLLAAAGALRERANAPQLLIGHSLGGAAVLAAAQEIPECVAVATLGAPSDPAHVTHLFGDAAYTEGDDVDIEVSIGGRDFTIRREFLDDIQSQDLLSRVSSLNRALLVMHSPLDDVVEIDHARRLYEAAKHPKSFISLDGADHMLSAEADAILAAGVLAAWATRYLGQPAKVSRPVTRLEDGVVLVEETGDAMFTQSVRVGQHLLLADEPESVGGADAGPNPYDLLLAGLGACTSMTMRLYARRKELDLRRIRVQLTHRKVHANDCENCATQEGKLDQIERVVRLEGNLSAEQRTRLLEIAERCPVHRTLHSEVRVLTREG